jgi:L-seryl-tRNA(Ser) seleniumtransferase
LYWDESKVKLTPKEAAQKLREGEPAIEVVPGQQDALTIGVWMMQPGDAEVVARRVRQVLKSAAVGA